MNTRKLVTATMFLAMGYILHLLIPGLPLGSMKPDPFLAMMFLAIIYVDDFKGTLAIGAVAGLLTAMTTTFPMGQIPNLIDKAVTAPAFYLLYTLLRNLQPSLRTMILAPIGTMISGTVFLANAQVFFQLPAPFAALFAGVVIPAMVSNTVLVLLIDKVMDRVRLAPGVLSRQ